MKKRLLLLSFALVSHMLPAAIVTLGSWSPIYQGIDLASGSQQPTISGEATHQVLCLRVDLTNPDIALFTTPHCPNCGLETLAEPPSQFLVKHGLQAVVNGGFYTSSAGTSDSAIGTPEDVYGLAISQGVVVSLGDDPGNAAVFMFASNNVAFFVPTNIPPTNTSGMFTAISGNRPLLRNGVNLQAATPADLDPRTGLGLSQDRRYLFLLTVDGRQPGWSDGADFHDTGDWLRRFGAYDGINADGGGSTTMVRSDCVGGAVRLNRSSYVAAYGRERNTGHNFGVYAKPLPSSLQNLNTEPATTTATITWGTDVPATTQVLYGSTTNLGSATPFDARLARKHVATLAGLTPGASYYFNAVSTYSGQTLTQACRFSTTLSLITTPAFGLTQVWRFATNNLDGTGWKTNGYNDAGWYGSGPGLLYVENATYVAPKNTALPPPYGSTIPRTYYFRTHFSFANSLTGASLVFSNYVDDGAVFYLNGAELYRLRIAAAPTTILNTTAASGTPCTGTSYAGDAATICPDVFTISGNLATNLVKGDNVVAVEVHNYTSGNDLVFGSALFIRTPAPITPQLNSWLENNVATLFWNGEGFTLQQATDLAGAGNWANVPGPVTQSPFSTTNLVTKFFRLKK